MAITAGPAAADGTVGFTCATPGGSVPVNTPVPMPAIPGDPVQPILIGVGGVVGGLTQPAGVTCG